MLQGVLKVTVDQLNLPRTLATGQNFRWRQRKSSEKEEEEEWIGLLDNRLVVSLVQRPELIEYRLLNQKNLIDSGEDSTNIYSNADLERRLQAYFRLDEDLDQLYRRWSGRDAHFAQTGAQFRGIRLLRQNLVENIFSFICSSNNNISRIGKMIEALATNYGTKLYSFEDDGDNSQPDIFSFPAVQELAKDQVEAELRKLSFGYRSRYINSAAKQIISEDGTGLKWLDKLQVLNYEDARRELMSLPGVGAKVADCICLMGLGHRQAVPVDTHVYQITAEHYLPQLLQGKGGTGKGGAGKRTGKQPALTAQRYGAIGDFYRERFEVAAGWAQTVLFAAHLKQSS